MIIAVVATHASMVGPIIAQRKSASRNTTRGQLAATMSAQKTSGSLHA